MTKWYSIKYVLTKGIQEVEAAEPKAGDSYIYPSMQGGYTSQLKVGRDAFRTRKEAVEAAYKVRDKRIASMQASIKRLKALMFFF